MAAINGIGAGPTAGHSDISDQLNSNPGEGYWRIAINVVTGGIRTDVLDQLTTMAYLTATASFILSYADEEYGLQEFSLYRKCSSTSSGALFQLLWTLLVWIFLSSIRRESTPNHTNYRYKGFRIEWVVSCVIITIRVVEVIWCNYSQEYIVDTRIVTFIPLVLSQVWFSYLLNKALVTDNDMLERHSLSTWGPWKDQCYQLMIRGFLHISRLRRPFPSQFAGTISSNTSAIQAEFDELQPQGLGHFSETSMVAPSNIEDTSSEMRPQDDDDIHDSYSIYYDANRLSPLSSLGSGSPLHLVDIDDMDDTTWYH